MSRVEVEALAERLGSMSDAMIAAARSFLQEKLAMTSADVEAANIREACWSTNECLCVRFATIAGAKSLNNFKRNLPATHTVEDFVPPCLQKLEEILEDVDPTLADNSQLRRGAKL